MTLRRECSLCSLEADLGCSGRRPIPSSAVGYYAYGSVRNGSTSALPTDRTFTGQEQDTTGLMYYHARFFDPALGTFVSPDTMVPEPGRAIDYNRFAYTRNNPLRYSDPTGHAPSRGCEYEGCSLADSLPADGTWIHPTFGVSVLDPEYLDDPLDALLVGAGTGVTLDTPLGFQMSGRVGVEYVINMESGQQDLFFSAGGSLDFSLEKLIDNGIDPLRVFSKDPVFSLGPAASIYVGGINNLPQNEDYRGWARAEETLAGVGPITVFSGEFHTPGEPEGPAGKVFGWAPSTGFNLGKSAVVTKSTSLRSIWGALVAWSKGQ